jgi:DivIVA domain-containing protein
MPDLHTRAQESRLVSIPEPELQGLRPSSIAGRGFSLVRKGYEPEEVQRFLRDIAEQVSRLQGELEWLRARSEHLERRSVAAQEAAYARLSRDFMEVVRRADEAAGRVKYQAEAKAQSDLVVARRDAEKILSEAKLEAERILAAARIEAHGIEWESKGAQARPAAAPEAPSARGTGSSGVDLPTLSIDIEAMWEREDEELLPSGSRANGHARPKDDSNGRREPEDPENLDFYLDVSIVDLFDNPQD